MTEEKIKDKVVSRAKDFFQKIEVTSKKIKNRTPDGVKVFFGQFVKPYISIVLVGLFVFVANYAHAAENANFVVSTDVMDLQPAEVANIVNNIDPYTPNYQEDAVSVALAMKNDDFLGKPFVTETANTVIEVPVQKDNRKNTITYTVDSNDTLSSIGWTYGLKIATIKSVNNLSSETIRPGQVLKLPPGDISPAAIKLAATNLKKKVAGASTVNAKPGSKNNAYPYGWCTYYVASRRYVPGGWGNAQAWLGSARRSGYATGSTPVPGAIMVSSESWIGHVAYVESVSGDSFTVSEMNYKGWGITSQRTISTSNGRVMGFIY